jgi:hypothetical protein
MTNTWVLRATTTLGIKNSILAVLIRAVAMSLRPSPLPLPTPVALPSFNYEDCRVYQSLIKKALHLRDSFCHVIRSYPASYLYPL